MFFHDAFLVIAACYRQPDVDLGHRLDQLCNADPMHQGISHNDIHELKNLFGTSDLNELRRDHARLFVGPFELVAPPFGSVYLEGRRTLMGQSTQDAMDLYRQAGLDMAGDFNNPPDHIIAELEFLAYLHSARQAANQDTAGNLQDLHNRFIRKHLGAWIESFTIKMEQGAETGFYKLLGKVTREMVRAETSL